MLAYYKDDLEIELKKKPSEDNSIENKWRERLYKRLDIIKGSEEDKHKELSNKLEELSAKITNENLEKHSKYDHHRPYKG